VVRLLLCALLAACGSSSDVAADLGPDLAPACNDPNPPDGGVCPVHVSGRVVDEGGAAVGALTVSVCAGECFFGTTLSDGSFSVVPDSNIVVGDYALEVHGRPDHASYYTPLPAAAGDDVTFAKPLPLFALPASGPEIRDDMTAQTVTSGEVTVTIPASTKIFFDVEDFGTPNGHQLRVEKIDPAKAPFVDQTLKALYACSPFEISFMQKVSLTIDNTAAFPAGSAVEILSLGGLVNGSPPAGHLKHAASAHVSADGKTITTDAGEGVSELTWLAVKEGP
jgi:hypothetical protein